MNASKMIQRKVDSVMLFRSVSDPHDEIILAGEVLVYCSGTYRTVADIVSDIEQQARVASRGCQRKFTEILFKKANAVPEAMPTSLERDAFVTWLENYGSKKEAFPEKKKPVSSTVFDHIARIAVLESHLFRQGNGWLVLLDGSIMMSSVLEEDNYRYYQHF